MARSSNHDIVEVWRFGGGNVRFHVTSAGRVLKSTGPRCGNMKIIQHIKMPNGAYMFGTGHLPTAEFKWVRTTADVWKRESAAFKLCTRES